MNYLSIFTVSFIIALSGALAPGPLLASVIAQSAKHGFKAGPLMIAGHGILEIAMVIAIAAGLSSFLNNSLIIKIISLSGALILLFFGLNILRTLPFVTLNSEAAQKETSSLALMGITMSIANPYWTIWWLTIGLGLILSAQKAGVTALGVFFLGHITADLGWYSFVSFTISRSRKFLSNKVYKTILFICAIVLIGFGIFFMLNTFSL